MGIANSCFDFCGDVVDWSESFDEAAKRFLRDVEWYSNNHACWDYNPQAIKTLRDAINRVLAKPDVDWFEKMELLTLAWQVHNFLDDASYDNFLPASDITPIRKVVIHQMIPNDCMTPLECCLLTRILESKPDGDGIYFFADESSFNPDIKIDDDLTDAVRQTIDSDLRKDVEKQLSDPVVQSDGCIEPADRRVLAHSARHLRAPSRPAPLHRHRAILHISG